MNPPTDSFVPLLTAIPSAEKREFQITVIPQKEQPLPFKAIDSPSPAGGERTFLKKQNCEPHLSVQRDGGRITNIRIQCNCGQTIDVACLYEEAAQTP